MLCQPRRWLSISLCPYRKLALLSYLNPFKFSQLTQLWQSILEDLSAVICAANEVQVQCHICCQYGSAVDREPSLVVDNYSAMQLYHW